MKKLTIILGVLLVITTGIIITNICVEHKANEISVEGTFMYSPVEGYSDLDRDAYVVFDDEGKYLIYQQGDVCLDEGRYELEGKTIKMVSDKGVKKLAYIENDNVFCDIDGKTVKAERNSDIPTYLNYTHD